MKKWRSIIVVSYTDPETDTSTHLENMSVRQAVDSVQRHGATVPFIDRVYVSDSPIMCVTRDKFGETT